jgi:hypothetical protein
MWFIAFLFIASMTLWSAVLWLALPIDIFEYSLPHIVAMHLVPPLLTVAAIMLAARWAKRRQLARAQAAQENQQRLHDTEKKWHRQKWEEDLTRRRGSIDCRWAVVADVVAHVFAPGNVDNLLPNTAQAFARFYSAPESTPLDWPMQTIAASLEELFAELPLAAGLPIAIAGASHQAHAEIAAMVQQAHAQAIRRHALQPQRHNLFATLAIPRAISPHSALLTLFEQQPDWPGAIVLAFDSPWRTQDNEGWQYQSPAAVISETEKWRGKPGRAVTIMLVTPASLNTALEKLAILDDGVTLDSMTPFWERQQIPAGMASFLTQLPRSWRDQLLQLPVIARLHRPAAAEIDFSAPFNQRVERCRQTITAAAINAALVEPDFEFNDVIEPGPQPSTSLRDCGWLIHNAGNIAFCGDRMALLLSSLWQEGVELDLDHTTNTVMTLGDCGESSSWLWLALGVQRVAVDDKPVVVAQFQEHTISLCFVTAAHE